MRKNCFELAAVGLSETVLNNIREVVGNSHLGGEVLLPPPFAPWREGDIGSSLKKEYDIILINPIIFKRPLHKVITEIKNTFPLTEIIVVSFTSNYRLAIYSFRAGARDILSYPFSSAEIVAVLDRALSYRHLWQKSNYLGDFLEISNLFGDYRKINTVEELFSKMELFTKKKFDASFLWVLKFSLNDHGLLEKFAGRPWPLKNHNQNEVLNPFQEKFIDKVKEQKNREALPYSTTFTTAFTTTYSNTLPFQDKLCAILDLGRFEGRYYLATFAFAQVSELTQLDEYRQDLLQQFSRITHGLFQQISNFKINRQLSLMVYIDDVSGLYNQRKLYSDIETLIQKYSDTKEIFSVLFIDIDHFKKVNDIHGHLVGSALLQSFSLELQKIVRESDLIYRYGGDEFVIILPLVSGERACIIAARISNIIKNQKFPIKIKDLNERNVELQLSVSIGIAQYPLDAASKDEILARADHMMYNAKKISRGSVYFGNKIFSGEMENLIEQE
ncbi:MAG: diguanylate cyclase [Oligoflexia bacterium]|nr:diguanylate cyclase [Oligoflexia bacterium]